MAVERQRTLARRTSSVAGVGLHSGKSAMVLLEPAPADAGFSFKRNDLRGAPVISAVASNVESTARCVTLERDGARVKTVEHILAACVLAGLDNAMILVEGDEVPAMDGSALAFLELIEAAGVKEQEKERAFVEPPSRFEAAKGEARIYGVPALEPSLKFRFRGIPALDGSEAIFGQGGLAARDIASARTFCFEDEIGPLLQAGLGQGGSLETVLVLHRDGSSVNAARDPREPLRHKLLDLVGDMALAGAPLRAEVTAEGTGHALHVEFISKLMEKTKKEATSRDA